MDPQDICSQSRENGCLFCDIVNKQTDTEILLSDDELVCFVDSKPGAMHHYLVVPRTHLGNCKTLQKDHIPLVERMQEMGRHILEKNKIRDLGDVRLGFHLPPFSSVPHLHLHILAPASHMSSRSLSRYGPQSCWFITAELVMLLFFKSITEEARTMAFEERTATIRAHHVKAASKKILKKAKG